MNKPLDAHKQVVGNSWSISSMVAPILSGVIVVLSGDEVNPIFCITLIIFFKGLRRYSCNGLEYITTDIN